MADVAVIGFGLWFAYSLRGLEDPERYIPLGAAAALLFLLCGGGSLRDGLVSATPMSSLASALSTWAMVLGGMLVVAWMTKTTADYSRVVLGLWSVSAALGLMLWRLAAHFALRRADAKRHAQPVAIVGTGSGARRFAHFLNSTTAPGFDVLGFFAETPADEAQAAALPHPLVGDFDALVAKARHREISSVFIALPPSADEQAHRLVNALSDTPATVYLVPSPSREDFGHARWISLHGLPLVRILESPFTGTNVWIKRAEDLAISVGVLTLAAVPMLLIAAAVKLSSPGPVIFRQRRHGIDGREVVILKFRTMTVEEDGPGMRPAVRADSRLTSVGALLRRTSFDELPQFFNVLRGEMSVVGPRPHAVDQSERLRQLIPGYMLRHRVKPGITGWAQVHGLRGSASVEHMRQRVRHDLWYIGHWSLWLDLRIVVRTAVLLAGDPKAL